MVLILEQLENHFLSIAPDTDVFIVAMNMISEKQHSINIIKKQIYTK